MISIHKYMYYWLQYNPSGQHKSGNFCQTQDEHRTYRGTVAHKKEQKERRREADFFKKKKRKRCWVGALVERSWLVRAVASLWTPFLSAGASACSGSPCSPGLYGSAGKAALVIYQKTVEYTSTLAHRRKSKIFFSYTALADKWHITRKQSDTQFISLFWWCWLGARVRADTQASVTFVWVCCWQGRRGRRPRSARSARPDPSPTPQVRSPCSNFFSRIFFFCFCLICINFILWVDFVSVWSRAGLMPAAICILHCGATWQERSRRGTLLECR